MQMVDVIGLFLNSTPPLDFLRHLPQQLHLLCHHHHLTSSPGKCHRRVSLGYNFVTVTAAKGKGQYRLSYTYEFLWWYLFPFKLTICCL